MRKHPETFTTSVEYGNPEALLLSNWEIENLIEEPIPPPKKTSNTLFNPVMKFVKIAFMRIQFVFHIIKQV